MDELSATRRRVAVSQLPVLPPLTVGSSIATSVCREMAVPEASSSMGSTRPTPRSVGDICVPDLCEDILLEHRYAILSTPTPSLDFRRSRNPQRRGSGQVCNRTGKQIAGIPSLDGSKRQPIRVVGSTIEELQLSASRNFQADEIRRVVRSKKHPIWNFTTIEVWSRL